MIQFPIHSLTWLFLRSLAQSLSYYTASLSLPIQLHQSLNNNYTASLPSYLVFKSMVNVPQFYFMTKSFLGTT